MSLSVLLDYRLEDNKEHSFEVGITSHSICFILCCRELENEAFVAYRLMMHCPLSLQVSLFAELFNEMLQRDFGYRIYKAFAALPSKEEKKEKKAKVEAEKKEAEKREIKKEKEEENEETPAKKTKEDEDDKRKASLSDIHLFFILICRLLSKDCLSSCDRVTFSPD